MLHGFGNYKVFSILYVWANKILNNPEGGTSTACCQNISQTHKYSIISGSIGVHRRRVWKRSACKSDQQSTEKLIWLLLCFYFNLHVCECVSVCLGVCRMNFNCFICMLTTHLWHTQTDTHTRAHTQQMFAWPPVCSALWGSCHQPACWYTQCDPKCVCVCQVGWTLMNED